MPPGSLVYIFTSRMLLCTTRKQDYGRLSVENVGSPRLNENPGSVYLSLELVLRSNFQLGFLQ